LFTPAEREKYRIADTSWIRPGRPTPSGSVERYFGAGGVASQPPNYASPTPPIMQAGEPYVPGGATSVPTTWTNYGGVGYVPNAVPVAQPQTGSYGTAIASASKNIGEAFRESAAQQAAVAQSRMAAARANVPTTIGTTPDPWELLRAAAQSAFGG
jgi:hypothetical protein